MQLLTILISLLFLFGCEQKSEIGFYHWKSKCGVSKDFTYPIYLKVLDIGSKKVIKTSCKADHIPVVYIDNKALKDRDNISKIILKNIPKSIKELQIDCDWTLSSKKKYFNLLKNLNKSYKKITATIRLHQVKFFDKTGVPPVDSGVLMFYNMSDFLDVKTKNYILDLDEAKKYIKNFDSYPLRLDLALPLYSMATIIRYNKVIKVMDNIKVSMLDSNFLHLQNNRYKVIKTHYFKGSLLYEGDIIRVDEVSFETLKKSLKLLPFNPKKIIFFRYSNLKDWNIEDLKDLNAKYF